MPPAPTQTAPTPSGTITLNDGTQLDSGVVKVMRAIRQVESQGNFNAVGDNGSSLGAYQWNNDNKPLQPGQLPSHFVAAAKQYGLDPTDFSPANQNKVAYQQILAYKNEGRTPIEIDALWNGAHKDAATGQYVHNNPERLTAFQQALSQEVGGGTVPESATPEAPPSVGGFLGNVVQSGANLVGNLGNAVLHPVQTAQTLGAIPVGGLQELGGQQNQNTQTYDNFVNFFKQRYGSPEAIGHTIYKDPVGFLADLSTAFTGAAGAVGAGAKLADVAGLGDVAKVGTAGEIGQEASGLAGGLQTGAKALGKAADLTNPISPVIAGGKALAGMSTAGGSLAAQGANLLTGGGADAASSLYRAASAGGDAAEAARSALRGEISPNAIVEEAINGLEAVHAKQSADFQEALAQIKDIKGSEDISPVLKTLDSQLKTFNIKVTKDGLDFSRSTLSDGPDAAKVQQAHDIVKSWGSQPGDRTPEGIYILTKKLDNLFNARTDGKPVSAFLTPIRQSARRILSNVPGYDEKAAQYGQTQDLIDELKGTFSLKGAARDDTIFKKLIGALRQNDALKTQLLKVLSDAGGSNLEAKLAGASYSPFFARNIMGKIVEAGGVYGALKGLLSPSYITGTLATSPRLMGEFIMALGASKTEATHFTAALTALKKIIPVADTATASQSTPEGEPQAPAPTNQEQQ